MTFRVLQLVIAKTLSVSPAWKLCSVPGFPHIPWEMYHTRPALLTVFSTTQLGHSITQCVLMLSRFWGCLPSDTVYRMSECKCSKISKHLKTVMNNAPSVPIGDFENTLSFPSVETSLGSGLPSHLPMGDLPCPHGALLTVFSTTQLEHSITQCEFTPSRFRRYLFKILKC